MIGTIHISDFITILITFVLYGLLISGLGLLYSNTLAKYYQKFKMISRLKARKKALRGETRLEHHIRRHLAVSMKNPMEPNHFLMVNVAIFISIVLIGIQNVTFMPAVVMAILISSMPYLLLRVRLETVRRKGSYEGEKLISEFLSQYRICNYNIYRTIEKVILLSEGTKISGNLLFKLLLSIRNTGDRAVISEATQQFAYVVNTNWSRMLANNIRISAEKGTNVTLALEDILIQLREARAMAEERKRLNSEAVRMVVFLIPLLYLSTVVMSVHYLGISTSQFIENQMYTSQGFLLMLLITFLFLVNLILIEIVSNQRFDY